MSLRRKLYEKAKREPDYRFYQAMRHARRVILRVHEGEALAVFALAVVVTLPGRAAADSNCGLSGTHTLCVSAADSLTGNAPIAVTSSPNSGTVIFRWLPNGGSATALMTDFAPSPATGTYSFRWPTHKYADATGLLQAFSGSTANTAVSISVRLVNGGFHASPNDWKSFLPPASWAGGRDAVVAAVGDGASDQTTPNALSNAIFLSGPKLFLYLGDVYEKGTFTENYNHYGRSSLDGLGTLWGRLATITQPTMGDHEAGNSRAWRDYWHQRPLWTSFKFGGVLFLDLNSSKSMTVGSSQYTFVQNVLAGPTPPCIVAFWHKPTLSGISINASRLPMWTLLTDSGGDLVLNGDLHSMAEYLPLNDQLRLPQVGQPTMVELINGAGGHKLANAPSGDARRAWSKSKTPGTTYLTLDGSANGGIPTSLSWTFVALDGTVLRSSSKSCL